MFVTVAAHFLHSVDSHILMGEGLTQDILKNMDVVILREGFLCITKPGFSTEAQKSRNESSVRMVTKHAPKFHK